MSKELSDVETLENRGNMRSHGQKERGRSTEKDLSHE